VRRAWPTAGCTCLQGTPKAPQRAQGLRDHGASLTAPPTSIAPTTSRRCPPPYENLEFAHPARSGPPPSTATSSARTSSRNDRSCATSSSAGKTAQASSASASTRAAFAGTLGNRPSATAPTSSAVRSKPAGVLSQVLSARHVVLIIAASSEPGKALALTQKHLGAFPGPSAPQARSYGRAGPGRRAPGGLLRRVGTVGSVGAAYHIPAASHADWRP